MDPLIKSQLLYQLSYAPASCGARLITRESGVCQEGFSMSHEFFPTPRISPLFSIALQPGLAAQLDVAVGVHAGEQAEGDHQGHHLRATV